MADERSEEPEERVFRWYLESLVEGGRQLRRITVHPLPFRVGRLPGLDLSLASDSVSKEHAELFVRRGQLRVVDLASKNGTFVNSERVTEVAVREGDILHFAQVEFRVGRQEIEEPPSGPDLGPPTAAMARRDLPRQFVEGSRQLPELLARRQVTSLFQPIVSLPSGAVAGYEALGRGEHAQLPREPRDLFRIAAGVGAEAALSALFREKALELTRRHPRISALFLNVHPAELDQPDLLGSIVDAHQDTPGLRITLELEESALADFAAIERLRSELSRCNVALAYDDFGAGQARLLELAEAPPHFLKFDMSFVRGIDRAPQTRRLLLSSLVGVARDLLVYTVAEGVETAEEADVCMRVGFTHAQGFFYGRPCPIDEI
jgi:EAL domain-containing protein (putative c-di-GMP-specific phosphodiesterase class I)